MLSQHIIDEVVSAALAEDAPWGDITSTHFVDPSLHAMAQLGARESGVFSGASVFTAAFQLVNPDIEVSLMVQDGETFDKGAVLANVSGPAQGVLQAERVALNFVQRMSGIATLTSHFVDAVHGTQARIADTRKTTPLLRAFERAAVVAGGGVNHRFSLSDAVLIKDNHLAVLTAQGRDLTEELRALRRRLGHTVKVEVEVDRLDQIEPVLAGGVDVIMLDNFTVEELEVGVRMVGGRAIVEASGGVHLDTVQRIARTGVDVISVGALTHSSRALDLGLDVTMNV